jgi:hypothetical protein
MVEQRADEAEDDGSIPSIATNKYGAACTKAGVSPLQGESGEFDSHVFHGNSKTVL